MDRLRKARNMLNLLFLWTKVDVSRLEKSFVWCRRPDSNRHVFLRLILNQLRLPISPLRHRRGCGNVTDYTCHALACKRHRVYVALSAEKIIASAFKRQFIHILLSIRLIQDVRFPQNTLHNPLYPSYLKLRFRWRHLPQRTYLSKSKGTSLWPPFCNVNYLGYTLKSHTIMRKGDVDYQKLCR